MFNVLDNCYCQNLAFEHPLTTASAVPQILEGERQLEEWRYITVPSLGMKLWHEPLLQADLAQLDLESTIRHRFGIVLSVRYHNLRILLYRKFLEGFLDAYYAEDSASQENKLAQQMGLTGVQNCVESAKSIISTVHTITSSGGWHRGLLGAWNYSLYYSKFIRIHHRVRFLFCFVLFCFFYYADCYSLQCWSCYIWSPSSLLQGEPAQPGPVAHGQGLPAISGSCSRCFTPSRFGQPGN